jgi:hypothetical protein
MHTKPPDWKRLIVVIVITMVLGMVQGWEFKGDGKCTRIPQVVDPKAHEVACASSRSSATTFPVQVGPCSFLSSVGIGVPSLC